MIEKSTVELINIFIDLAKISANDENGQRHFRLPLSEVNSDNWKQEFELPIDKYDWLIFDQIIQPVFQYSESKREEICMCK